MKAPSEFKVWFELQHGKRPSNKPIYELRDEAEHKQAIAAAARSLCSACELYDEKETSALYAWQASHKRGVK